MNSLITNKFLRFLQDKAKKEERSFMEFYKDYGFFLKEGILSGTDQVKKLGYRSNYIEMQQKKALNLLIFEFFKFPDQFEKKS